MSVVVAKENPTSLQNLQKKKKEKKRTRKTSDGMAQVSEMTRGGDDDDEGCGREGKGCQVVSGCWGGESGSEVEVEVEVECLARGLVQFGIVGWKGDGLMKPEGPARRA